jgi:hypothetical protein
MPETLLHYPVESLHQVRGGTMVCSAQCDLGAQCLEKALPKFRSEELVFITNELSTHPMEAKDIVQIKLGTVLSSEIEGTGKEVTSPSHSIHNNQQLLIPRLCECKRAYKVHHDTIPRPGGVRDRKGNGWGPCILRLHDLTGHACANIFFSILSHAFPIVSTPQGLYQTFATSVTTILSIMQLME